MLHKIFKIDDVYHVYDSVSNNIYIISKNISAFLSGQKSINDLNKEEQEFIEKMQAENCLKLKEHEEAKFDLLDNFTEKFNFTKDSIKKLTLVLNQKCNFSCKYCLYCDSYKQRKNLDNSGMDIDTAKKAIDFYFKHSKNVKFKNITIYGGEPLIDFDKLSEIIVYARKKYSPKTLKINLTSNGSLLNEEIIDFFNKNKIFLNISIDGPKEIHDKYRLTKDKKGTFDLLLKNILKIKKLSPEYFRHFLALSVTITPPYEYKKVEEFFKNNNDLKTLKLDLSYVEEKDADWLSDKNIYKEKIEKEKKIIKKCTDDYIAKKEISDLYRNIFFTRLKTIAGRNVTKEDKCLEVKGPCFPSLSMLVVNTDGKFNMCTMLDDCYSIGDLNKGLDKKRIKKSLEDLFLFINNNCRKCWLNRICRPCIAKFNQGEELPERSNICDYRRSIYLEIIKSYIKINNSKS